jgi:hypothetical protein
MNDTSPVRALARRFANGTLERRTYVVERRRIIDAIAAGDLELPVERSATPPGPALDQSAACTLTEMDATVELRSPALAMATPAATARGWWLVAGLMLGILGVATWLWIGLASA